MDSPWNPPGQNTGVGCHSLLQGIFPTQGSNPDLVHCRRILYQLSHQGNPFSRGYVVTIYFFPLEMFSVLADGEDVVTGQNYHERERNELIIQHRDEVGTVFQTRRPTKGRPGHLLKATQ